MRKNRLIRVCALALVLLAFMAVPALAKVVSPGPDFYYLDNANVLSEALEGEIFFANKLLYDACGAQIVVVTVDSTGRDAIDDYAYELFNSWGIGDAAKDNGFLLLLAIEDDDYYAPDIIYTGTRPENIINMIAQGMGVTLFSERFFQFYNKPGTSCVAVTPTAVTRMGLVRNKRALRG